MFENVSLFEHRQYFIDTGAGLDQRPSIPVEHEVATLIFAKSKKDGFVVRIENGDHELTIVHRRWDTCAGNAFRTQRVAKRSQGGNIGGGKAVAVERDDRHWSGGLGKSRRPFPPPSLKRRAGQKNENTAEAGEN